jgi:outer membrane lipoprotein-sorting protein
MATIGTVLALMHDWASRPRPTRGSFRVEGPKGTSRYRFWWLRPDCYRLEEVQGYEPGSVTVRRDREVWSVRKIRAYHRREVAGYLTALDNLFMASFGGPGEPPPTLKGNTTVAGRSAALVVVSSPWRGHSDEIESAVDVGNGIVLRRVQLLAGNPIGRTEIEEVEIDIELPAELFAIELPQSMPVIELADRSAGFPILEDLPRLLPFQVWVPNRPRELQVVSVDTDTSTVRLVWVADRGTERGLVVEATEGRTAWEDQLAEPETIDVDGVSVRLSINKRRTPQTWLAELEKGGTTILLDVRGSRAEALASARGLIPLSSDKPELVQR